MSVYCFPLHPHVGGGDSKDVISSQTKTCLYPEAYEVH